MDDLRFVGELKTVVVEVVWKLSPVDRSHQAKHFVSLLILAVHYKPTR